MRRLLTLLVATAMAAMTMVAAEQADGSGDYHPSRLQLAWGAEFGSSIDLSAHDMSSIDFGAFVGVKRGWLQFLGAGVTADIMVSNSCRSYPVYAMIRSRLLRRSELLFVDARCGVALNFLTGDISQTGLHASLMAGVNLARGRHFRSYLLAGYTFQDRRNATAGEHTYIFEPLHLAVIRLGITF